jgi:hypothetical protein
MTLQYLSSDATTGIDATGTLPSGFTALSGTWTVNNSISINGHANCISYTGGSVNQVALLEGPGTLSGVDMSFCLPNNAGLTGNANLEPFVCANAANNNGYLLIMLFSSTTAGQLWLFRRDPGGDHLITNPSVTLASGSTNSYTLRLQVQGGSVRGKVWSTNSAEPDWQINTTDSTYSSGYCGFQSNNGGVANVTAADVVINTVAANQVMVDQPQSPTVSTTFTASGIYYGTAPTAMDYAFDATTPGSWAAMTGFSTTTSGVPISGGGHWQGTVTAPSATGLHTLIVRDHNTTTVQGASASFTAVSGSSTISVTTPGTLTQSASYTLAGTYTGTAPTGVQYAYDGGSSYTVLTGFSASGGTWSGTATAPASTGSHTVTVQETNNTSITATSSSFTVSAATTTIPADGGAFHYSPYNWNVGSGRAKTICCGAYFSTVFTGGSCTATFDMTGLSTPYPQIWYRIDGTNWLSASIAATVALTMPSTTTGWAKHHLEVIVKSTSEWMDRWNTQAASVAFTGLTLASGQTAASPTASPQRRIVLFGDSITEGYLSVSNTTDTAGSDVTVTWGYQLRHLLGADVSVIACGGQGITQGGQGNWPSLINAWNFHWSGQARTYTPTPDLIVINQGQNDGATGSGFQSQYASTLNAILAGIPNCPVVILIPFSQSHASDIPATVTAVGNSRVHYITTSGFFDSSLSVDGVHPLGVAALDSLAPQVAEKLRPFLNTSKRWSYS